MKSDVTPGRRSAPRSMTNAGFRGRAAGILGWLALAAAVPAQAQMAVPPATYPPALVRKDAPAAK